MCTARRSQQLHYNLWTAPSCLASCYEVNSEFGGLVGFCYACVYVVCCVAFVFCSACSFRFHKTEHASNKKKTQAGVFYLLRVRCRLSSMKSSNTEKFAFPCKLAAGCGNPSRKSLENHAAHAEQKNALAGRMLGSACARPPPPLTQ